MALLAGTSWLRSLYPLSEPAEPANPAKRSSTFVPMRDRSGRTLFAVCAAMLAATLLAPGLAGAHPERPVSFPPGDGEFPKVRTSGGPQLVVDDGGGLSGQRPRHKAAQPSTAGTCQPANSAICGEIGATGFEPATFRPPAGCATRAYGASGVPLSLVHALLGNFLQAFSHIGLLHATYAISEARQ